MTAAYLLIHCMKSYMRLDIFGSVKNKIIQKQTNKHTNKIKKPSLS